MKKCRKMVALFMSAVLIFASSSIALTAYADETVEVTPWMQYTFDDENGSDTGTAKNDATAVGTPKFGTKTAEDAGPSGKYLELSADGYFIAPAQPFAFGTEAFTVSFWVNLPADHATNVYERVFQTGLWADTGFAIVLNRNGGGQAAINAAVSGAGEGDDWVGTWVNPGSNAFENDYYDGKWHLITVVFDQPNKKYEMYLDGEHVSTQGYTRDNLTASPDENKQYVGLGVFYHYESLPAVSDDHGLDYMLDDISMYKQALTAEQIKAYYDANKGNAQPFDPNKEATLTDSLSGISVTGAGLEKAQLYVSTVMSGATFDKLSETYGSFEKFILYDVSIERQDQPVEISEKLTFSINIPDKLANQKNLKVFIEEENGTLTEMDARSANGQLLFETTKLGKIAIVNTADSDTKQPGDSDEDGNKDMEKEPENENPITAADNGIYMTIIVLLLATAMILSRKRESVNK